MVEGGLDVDPSELSQIPLFAGLSRRDLELVSRHADEATVRAGTVIMREGERAMEVLVIVEGTAQVTSEGNVIAELGPGDVVGEIGVAARQPRNATVEAVTDLRVVAMFGPEYQELAEDVTELRARVLAIIEERLADQ